MHRTFEEIDDLLRGRANALALAGAKPLDTPRLLILIVLFGMLYGSVMGTFGGLAEDRPWQLFYSALKVPLLLLVTFGVSLPSYFVLNTLLGLRSDLSSAIRVHLATQVALTVILAAFAPFTALWYASSADYSAATAFNGLMFAMATLTAQVLLHRLYRPLIARNVRHRWLLRVWLGVYAFVAIQLAWVLRPFVGDPQKPVEFFRAEAWGNAYVVVWQLVWRLLLPQ